MTDFICIVTETLPAGLLPQISLNLNVSTSFAAQTLTVYALGSLIAEIPLTIATQALEAPNSTITDYYRVLDIFNTLTAL